MVMIIVTPILCFATNKLFKYLVFLVSHVSLLAPERSFNGQTQLMLKHLVCWTHLLARQLREEENAQTKKNEQMGVG